MKMRSFLFLAPVLALGPVANSVAGTLFTSLQGVGDNYLAFQAEVYDEIFDAGTPWVSTVDTLTTSPAPIPAGAGGALYIQGTTSSGFQGGASPITDHRVEYRLLFNTPGTYELYVRGYVPATPNPFAEGAPAGNNDSFFAMNNFGGSTTTPGDYNTAGTGHPPGGTNAWDWRSNNTFITVTPAQVGQVVPWAWAQREDNPLLDRFVFSQIQSLSDGALDALTISAVIPEPGRAALLALGFLPLMLRRRRR